MHITKTAIFIHPEIYLFTNILLQKSLESTASTSSSAGEANAVGVSLHEACASPVLPQPPQIFPFPCGGTVQGILSEMYMLQPKSLYYRTLKAWERAWGRAFGQGRAIEHDPSHVLLNFSFQSFQSMHLFSLLMVLVVGIRVFILQIFSTE